MSDQTLHNLEEAIKAHFEDMIHDGPRSGQGDMVIDWVLGITVSNIVTVDGDDIVGYANMAVYPEGNPNAHVALAAWVSNDIADILIADDED